MRWTQRSVIRAAGEPFGYFHATESENIEMQQQHKQELEQRTLRADDAPQAITDTAHRPDSAAAGPACAQDVVAYCQKEANVVALLREAPDVVEPRTIVEAVRKVRLCMVSHADVLSVDCVNTLSADVLGAASTMAASVPAKKVAELDNEDGVDDDSSMEINIYYSRHHNGASHALRSGGALAANHVQTAGGPSSALSEVLVHPLTWVFVLPFFVIGMYVSFSRFATFLRRRREERRIESKQYMPVN